MPLQLHSQQARLLRTINISQGLPNREVFRAEQDDDGFMWLFTKTGIYRYDGKNYTEVPLRTNSELRHTRYRVRSLVNQNGHEFWFVNYEYELCHILTRELQAEIVESGTSLFPAVLQGKVLSICQSQQNHIFVSTANPGAIWQLQPGKASMLRRQDSCVLLAVDEPNQIYFRTRENHQISFRVPFADQSVLPVQDAATFAINYHGSKVFLGQTSTGELKLISKNGMVPLQYSSSHDPIFDVQAMEDQQHHFWLYSTNYGIGYFDPGSGKVVPMISEDQKKKGLRVHHMCCDHNGLIWAATSNGIYLYEIPAQLFGTMLHDPGLSEDEYGTSTRAIAENKTSLFVGARGIISIDKSSGREENLVKDRTVYGIVTDGESGLWYTNYYPRINHFNLGTKVRDTIGMPDIATALILFSNDELWVSGMKNLYVLKIHEKKVIPFLDNQQSNPFLNVRVFEMDRDAENRIWMATSKGLACVLPNRSVVFYNRSTDLFRNQDLYSVKCNAGMVYIGSVKNGLYIFNPQTNSVIQISTSQGLSSNMVYSIEVADNYLWLGTEMGLSQINRNGGEIRNFFHADGISHNEFNLLSHLRAEDGRLLMGGLNGITEILPAVYASKPKNAALNMVSVMAFDGKTETPISLNGSFRKGSIVIPAGMHWVNFAFALTDYANPGANQYEYFLKGYEPNWVRLGTQNSVKYNNLPAGTYTLLVRAKPANGSWNSQVMEFTIIVKQVFYKQWWFILLCIVSIGLGLYQLYRFRVATLRKNALMLEQAVKQRTEYIEKQTVELQQLNETKSHFFANISHEFRTPLTLILGPLQELLQRKNNPDQKQLETVYGNAGKLKRMVDEVLDLSRLEKNAMELKPTPVNLQQLARRIFFSYQSVAESKHIVLEYLGKINSEQFVITDPEVFETILSNLLSNAIKFTNRGKITLQLELRNSESKTDLWMQVSDTGTGISETDLPRIFERYYQTRDMEKKIMGGTGIGLSLVKEFTDLMGGSIHVESRSGQGSQFVVQYPVDLSDITTETSEKTPAKEGAELEESIQNTERKPSILLVEDNHEMLQFLTENLSTQYEVRTAINGREALLKLQNHIPDLITTDIMMPEMDGMELLTQIRKEERLARIPVIMLTARSAEDDRLSALEAGVDDYVVKPFGMPELKVRIANLIRNSQNRMLWLDQHEGEIPELSADGKTLETIQKVVQKHLAESDYTMEALADELALSKRQLNRVITGLTGLTPLHYLREQRLNQARMLLEKKRYKTVAEVAYAVGFEKPGYFSSLFLKRYGVAPSSYL